MELSKIKSLIELVGSSNISALTVTENGTTVRISRDVVGADSCGVRETPEGDAVHASKQQSEPTISKSNAVTAPIFGVLHSASAPGEAPFVKVGDHVEFGQTLFIIEAMKVFNKIPAPQSGRIVKLIEGDGIEVEVGDIIAEIE